MFCWKLHIICLPMFFIFNLLQLPPTHLGYRLPSCTNSRTPLKLESPLKFCPSNGTVCCNPDEDLDLEEQFGAMYFLDPECASVVKSILCSICHPLSDHRRIPNPACRTILRKCYSSASEPLYLSENNSSTTLFQKIWEGCLNASIFSSQMSISNNLRVQSKYNSSLTLTKKHWLKERGYQDNFVGSVDIAPAHLSGEVVSPVPDTALESPDGVCLERIGDGNYISMIPHPDGSNRVFVHDLEGKIWLATVPENGSKQRMQVYKLKPFLDITHLVHVDTALGMVSLAFHTNFLKNGRFFVSYFCDKLQHPSCVGRCACNTDVNCDPSKIAADNGIQPCQYHVIIAEYTTNGTSSKPESAKHANPSEVRRIFTMGIPSMQVHGGQILFGPEDGHLYFMIGDNLRPSDHLSFSQDKGAVLGKILRLDINHIPSAKEIHKLGLWGNYSIPKDNPYLHDNKLAPEVWAFGLSLPWHCSFDSKRHSYFFCGDAGENHYEEIDSITKGGNYGWPLYEGPFKRTGKTSPSSSKGLIFPVMGYSHSEINKGSGSASVNGGYFYRSMTDPCLYGRYLFMDLYGESMWSAVESQESSQNFTTIRMDFRCAHESPLTCQIRGGSKMPALGYVDSVAIDNRYDFYLLATTGVYRVASPWRCGYQCAKESVSATKSRSPDAISLQPLKGVQLYKSFYTIVTLLLVFIL